MVGNDCWLVSGGGCWLLVGDWLTSCICVHVLAERAKVCAHAASFFCFYSTSLAAFLQHVRMLRGRGRLTLAEDRGVRQDPLFCFPREAEGGSLRNVSAHPLAEPSGPQLYCCCPPLLSKSISPFLFSARRAQSELVGLVHIMYICMYVTMYSYCIWRM